MIVGPLTYTVCPLIWCLLPRVSWWPSAERDKSVGEGVKVLAQLQNPRYIQLTLPILFEWRIWVGHLLPTKLEARSKKQNPTECTALTAVCSLEIKPSILLQSLRRLWKRYGSPTYFGKKKKNIHPRNLYPNVPRRIYLNLATLILSIQYRRRSKIAPSHRTIRSGALYEALIIDTNRE